MSTSILVQFRVAAMLQNLVLS